MTAPTPVPQLKGQLLQVRFEYVRERYGAEGLERVLESLPPEERTRLRDLQREGWYPFRTLVRLDRAIADTVADGDPAVFERLGLASAQQRTLWLGEHARLISVHAFLALAAEEHRRFHTFGRAVYRRLGFTHGEIAFSDYPEVDPTYCLSARGYLRGAVESLTGGPARVEERSCQCRHEPACLFDLRWEDRSTNEDTASQR